MSRPYKVLIDPGHGGLDPGAIAAIPDVKEKDINLSIAKLLRRFALREEFLFSPRLTRKKDTTLSLNARVKKIEKKKPDLFVSLHCNSYHEPEPEGVEVYFKQEDPFSRHFAQTMLDALLDAMPEHKNRGIHGKGFFVLRNSPVPAILIEYEFLSNPFQASLLVEESHQRLLAKTTAIAIEEFFEGGGI